MDVGPTLTTVMLVSIVLLVLVVLGLLLHRRRSRRGFLSVTDQATYETLHTASVAARHFADGFTDNGCERAAPYLQAMLATPALAICDTGSVIVWEGEGGHHLPSVMDQAEPVLTSGHTLVLGPDTVTCTSTECPVRAAVIAPICVEGRVLGALAAYGPSVTPGLARAVEELAGWVTTQVELVELSHERTRAMEAELRALRAQISPHFIYNSLAAIASFVRTDPERARELLLEFADFTRYALRREDAFTTMSEELHNVERYLVLEQARFGERLGITLKIAPEVLPVRLPYLTIQPLVENAVRHGLAPKEGPGTVTLVAIDHGTEAEFAVDDDGVGAHPESIRKILDGQTRSDSIGLGNVDARLRQVYGEERGLVVDTAPGAGMRVSFRVPKYSPALEEPA
ncbi:sensor histidine kinase [Janibacter corallicola]|uniref:sensor histidine kinase n=1 Tax=Janibacter corallicola TaxID=415212 RepID=UPI000A05A5C6|nr:histidine kinase [Janibacter corallicola]